MRVDPRPGLSSPRPKYRMTDSRLRSWRPYAVHPGRIGRMHRPWIIPSLVFRRTCVVGLVVPHRSSNRSPQADSATPAQDRRAVS
jgi:hypothetical protein